LGIILRGKAQERPSLGLVGLVLMLSLPADEITIRVRYAECDRMGLLHHANYFVYFEQGRIELLRSRGLSY
jgi:hypothetical protein